MTIQKKALLKNTMSSILERMGNVAIPENHPHQAAEIDALNEEIWKNFWEIPREKRTLADWEKLLSIQILVKKE